jgi:hypothetical protein
MRHHQQQYHRKQYSNKDYETSPPTGGDDDQVCYYIKVKILHFNFLVYTEYIFSNGQYEYRYSC